MKIKMNARYVNETAILEFGKYQNNSIAIQGYSEEGEGLFTATVALVDAVPDKGFVFLKGWSENEGIPEALEKAGIVKLTGKEFPAGYCKAQEAQLLVNPEM